jgi:hypothetical protein
LTFQTIENLVARQHLGDAAVRLTVFSDGPAGKQRNFRKCARGTLTGLAKKMPSGRSKKLTVSLPAGPKADAKPASNTSGGAMHWTGKTCKKAKSGCLACCGKRAVMGSDCRCMVPACRSGQIPIRDGCIRK